MSTQTLAFLVMTGSSEGSEPEVMVSPARQATTLDLVERALEMPALRPIVVSTNSRALAGNLDPLPVQDAPDPSANCGTATRRQRRSRVWPMTGPGYRVHVRARVRVFPELPYFRETSEELGCRYYGNPFVVAQVEEVLVGSSS